MGSLVRTWFAEHPPSTWVRALEGAVRALNVLLAALGAAVAVWSVVTVVQIQHAPPPHDVPWFIWAFGALGAATGLAAGTALLGIRLRSPGCLSSHIFLMCLLLTGQACAAVAFFMDKGWQQRLPEIDEQLKRLLAQRLQVCKWVGVSLLLLQLLELLLGCTLQSIYVGAEEAAEDADEEATWRRRPLLQQQHHSQQQQGIRSSPPGADADAWRERMQEQYGLDTTQFGQQPGGGGGSGSRDREQQGGRRCTIM